ncbi:MAG: glutamate--tRNA ligase [Patescibacteria group bacterium]
MNDDIKNKIIQKITEKWGNNSSLEELELKYPARNLPDGVMVTRVAPSPTGPMHVGTLYTSLISEKFAHQTGGVFYLRIEDTDKKREVAGATGLVVSAFRRYGIKADEGIDENGKYFGEYGPYKQSDRENIYHSYIKHLLEKDIAYLCFCSSEGLEHVRSEQESLKIRPGYYGKWAKCRNLSAEKVLENLENNSPYVVRFKSYGDFDKKIKVKDLLKGEKELSENDQDIVIMKSDKLPTYHLAHVIADHLMRTTHVIRGDEWFSSLTLHLQLFEAMGFSAPLYGHIAPIQKIDGNSKRKLSKRKDPEANVNFYDEQGYPSQAVVEYLFNLANSNFEDWRKANPDKSLDEFHLTFEKLANSNGALFDFKKLNDISKSLISKMSADEVYEAVLSWAKKHDALFAELLSKNVEYSKKIFGIEREGSEKRRKDLSRWSEARRSMSYFFDELFALDISELQNLFQPVPSDEVVRIVKIFLEKFNKSLSKDEWLVVMKKIAMDNGYAENTKEFKLAPEKYKGQLGDIAKIFRVLLSGRTQTPDLYEMMQAMGYDRVEKRLKRYLA